jgi:chemotaxis protein methyltransferase CheR
VAPDYDYFVFAVRRLTGIDLSLYRQNQMVRRLDALRERAGARDFAELAHRLASDPRWLQTFRDHVTIKVTEFFRDADRFHFLETRILPGLLADRPSLRVWSCACSNGAEPYSVAILLRELAPRGVHRILATDIDRTVLERAREGIGYTAAELRNVSPERRERCFHTSPNGALAVRPDVRSLVDFRVHNLLEPPPFKNFDLILCRNVVIYFTDGAKRDLYAQLVGALRPEGVLFMGATEVLPDASGLGLWPLSPAFYARSSAGSGPPTARNPAGTRQPARLAREPASGGARKLHVLVEGQNAG